MKKMFLEMSQNSQENTQENTHESPAEVFSCEFCGISKNNFCCRTPLAAAPDLLKIMTIY